MATPASHVVGMSARHANAIAQISHDLRLPLHQVTECYRAELERIGASARIDHYLSVLAASHTRAILRFSGQTSSKVH
jgi:hypothetical protein